MRVYGYLQHKSKFWIIDIIVCEQGFIDQKYDNWKDKFHSGAILSLCLLFFLTY